MGTLYVSTILLFSKKCPKFYDVLYYRVWFCDYRVFDKIFKNEVSEDDI